MKQKRYRDSLKVRASGWKTGSAHTVRHKMKTHTEKKNSRLYFFVALQPLYPLNYYLNS